jgi:hypothetical protein
MEPKSQRMTRFPGAVQSASSKVREKVVNTNRQTRFPGGSELQKISILESPITAKTKREDAQTLSRLPLRVNPPDAVPARPLPVMTIAQHGQVPNIRSESPWNTYKSLRTLERGGEVTAACRREVPVEMVAVKKLSSDYIRELKSQHANLCQHGNLLAVMGLYSSDDTFFVITDYTAATLKQIIAIPLPLEELHISATCHQGSSSSRSPFISLTCQRSLKECSICLDMVSHTRN